MEGKVFIIIILFNSVTLQKDDTLKSRREEIE